jgi:hypothetical protein
MDRSFGKTFRSGLKTLELFTEDFQHTRKQNTETTRTGRLPLISKASS